jgi:hypothetical protein
VAVTFAFCSIACGNRGSPTTASFADAGTGYVPARVSVNGVRCGEPSRIVRMRSFPSFCSWTSSTTSGGPASIAGHPSGNSTTN